MFGLLRLVLGNAQDRLLARYKKMSQQINQKAQEFENLSKEQLKAKTEHFRSLIHSGTKPDALLIDAMAVFKCMCARLVGEEIEVMGTSMRWDIVPYDVQLQGACSLHEGGCVQMQTGEGKTLTATMPLYFNALFQKAHLVTVNDYLAQRDCEWTGYVLRELGITTGYLANAKGPEERAKIYACDVVYGTASEFGFDYLRDNSMAQSKTQQVQQGYDFVIIDEADSILIDEARTPLIISGPSGQSRHLYEEIKDVTAQLIKEQKLQSAHWIKEAKEKLDQLKITQTEEDVLRAKRSKQEQESLDEAMDLLWKVARTTPRHRMLKKLKENPNIRALLDEKDLYYYGDMNKQEREETLSDLLIIVDEKRGDYELSDKGIDLWAKLQGDRKEAAEDFVMLHLGDEFMRIDSDQTLSEEDKMRERIAIQKEDEHRKERVHNLRQLLRAHLLMERDVDYIVSEGKVVIIDENTGRPQPGRRFSDGLHQAIEAKENLSIQGETQTYASITLQNYFRLYKKRAGMSGTCSTEAKEFKEIYDMEVIEIPTNLPCQRVDAPDCVYITQREKFQAILKRVKEIHALGRPILIGTESVDISEKLSRVFKAQKLPHTVLNAKNHAKEAQIVSEAGQKGSITISTNMAGRGTDIKLGEGVAELGGLFVLGTSRSSSRRIDRQLRGRCARQGDPGSSEFFVSFEDQLIRLFAGDRMNALIQSYRPEEGEAIVSSMLSKAIENAQKRVEQQHYSIRKHTLEYDNVMNNQRSEIYALRSELLEGSDTLPTCYQFIEEAIEILMEEYAQSQEPSKNKEDLLNSIRAIFPVPKIESGIDLNHPEQAAKELAARLIKSFDAKLAFLKERVGQVVGQEQLEGLLSQMMLHRLDQLWQLHLEQMDQARSNVQLRALGQKDPLMEYKDEAFALFEQLNRFLKFRICEDLFRFDIVPAQTEEMPQPEKLSNQVF